MYTNIRNMHVYKHRYKTYITRTTDNIIIIIIMLMQTYIQSI